MDDSICGRMKEMLIGFVEGELDENEEKIVKGHLSRCTECRASYNLLLDLEETLVSMKNELPSHNKTLAAVCRKLGFKREGVLTRFIHSPLFPVSLATVAAFVTIYISNLYVLELPEGFIDRASRSLVDLIKGVFANDTRIIIGVNLLLLSFFPLLWKRIIGNFINGTDGY